MQEYIMLLVASQNFIDIKNQVETERKTRSIRHELREEIMRYGMLKQMWGLGHVRCKLQKGECRRCMKKHCILTGYYRGYYEQTKQSMYLGFGYENAFARMSHVKAFL